MPDYSGTNRLIMTPRELEIMNCQSKPRPLDKLKSMQLKISFLISPPTYVVGSQKNRLNETVLSSIQNIC